MHVNTDFSLKNLKNLENNEKRRYFFKKTFFFFQKNFSKFFFEKIAKKRWEIIYPAVGQGVVFSSANVLF